MLSKELQTAIELALNNKMGEKVTVQSITQVFGGDINKAFILQTNAGKFFVKVNSIGNAGMFQKESDGLLLLAAANALAVPQPIANGSLGNDIFLVMAYIEKGKPVNNFWQEFGHGLAALHKNTNAHFGLNEDNYIGTIPQLNRQKETWTEFYAQQRILPLMRQALKQNKCTIKDMQAAERLCARFGDIFPVEPPSLLHGDLWGGNFMVGEAGQPVIFDPAVYYGHREMDIAMTMLFGGFDNKLYAYYDEAYPLQPGWKQRVQLCQLYPLLVHLLLFGGHYYNNVMEVINKY